MVCKTEKIAILLARMFHELPSRDRADGCAPGQPQGIGSEAYLNGTSQGAIPEDARKDGHIRGRSRRFMIHPGLAKLILWYSSLLSVIVYEFFLITFIFRIESVQFGIDISIESYILGRDFLDNLIKNLFNSLVAPYIKV